MEIVSKILGVVFALGLTAFIVFEIFGIVKDIKVRKKLKSENKNIEKGGTSKK